MTDIYKLRGNLYHADCIEDDDKEDALRVDSTSVEKDAECSECGGEFGDQQLEEVKLDERKDEPEKQAP